jgi:hypothetical protein
MLSLSVFEGRRSEELVTHTCTPSLSDLKAGLEDNNRVEGGCEPGREGESTNIGIVYKLRW